MGEEEGDETEREVIPAEQSHRFIDAEKKRRGERGEEGGGGDFLSRKLMHEFTSNNGRTEQPPATDSFGRRVHCLREKTAGLAHAPPPRCLSVTSP